METQAVHRDTSSDRANGAGPDDSPMAPIGDAVEMVLQKIMMLRLAALLRARADRIGNANRRRGYGQRAAHCGHPRNGSAFTEWSQRGLKKGGVMVALADIGPATFPRR